MSDLHSQLRAETAGSHKRLESLPFYSALQAGQLSRQSLITFVRCLAIIHAVLEHEFLTTTNATIRGFWDPKFKKLSFLMQDLKEISCEDLPDIVPATQAALQLADRIILDQSSSPLALIGYLYVLEGSQNGGRHLKVAFAKVLDLDPKQLTYFGHYGDRTAEVWLTFTQRLNALALTAPEEKAVAAGASVAFEMFEKILGGVYPFSPEQLRFQVTAVNPEAGQHAIPQNPVEIGIALRSGIKAWNKYPYLDMRYSERGVRFTGSDSCWLATLYRYNFESMRKNISWLRKILATRGIPTIILESHLTELYAEFLSCLPERANEFQKYEEMIRELQTERFRLLPPEALRDLESEFVPRFNNCPGPKLSSASTLIVSARLDEQSGIAGARDAVMQWVYMPGRFSDEWIAVSKQLEAQMDVRIL
jgi:heme oxygenase